MEKHKESKKHADARADAEQTDAYRRALLAEEYHGPSELATMAGRATLLGILGFTIGRMIGDAGDRSKTAINKAGRTKYIGLSARFWEIALSVSFAAVGIYTASRDIRDAKRQHIRLQKELSDVKQERDTLAVAVDLFERRDAWHAQQTDANRPAPQVDAAAISHERKIQDNPALTAGASMAHVT